MDGGVRLAEFPFKEKRTFIYEENQSAKKKKKDEENQAEIGFV